MAPIVAELRWAHGRVLFHCSSGQIRSTAIKTGQFYCSGGGVVGDGDGDEGGDGDSSGASSDHGSSSGSSSSSKRQVNYRQTALTLSVSRMRREAESALDVRNTRRWRLPCSGN
jgi:hypothetical protein